MVQDPIRQVWERIQRSSKKMNLTVLRDLHCFPLYQLFPPEIWAVESSVPVLCIAREIIWWYWYMSILQGLDMIFPKSELHLFIFFYNQSHLHTQVTTTL